MKKKINILIFLRISQVIFYKNLKRKAVESVDDSNQE